VSETVSTAIESGINARSVVGVMMSVRVLARPDEERAGRGA
jgi:microcompartment protein CcmL/EutN